MFLMDYEASKGEQGQGLLTAGKTATSKLVRVVVDVSVMGVSQSGIMLSLCRSQTELPDPVLEFMIRELAYADNLPSGVTAQEIADFQNELWSSIDWEEFRRPCSDWACFSPSHTGTSPPAHTAASTAACRQG